MNDQLSEFKKLTLLASKLQSAQTSDDASDLHPFDDRNIHPDIDAVARILFDDGHYSQATFEAFKYVDKLVSDLSGLNETGRNLMMSAFDETKPKIKLNSLSNMSEKDEQAGFRFMLAGAASAIRNPRGHEVGNIDSLEQCLDHLSFASFLVRRISGRISP